MNLQNTPEVKLGVVAVSRDCFPLELSRKRLGNLLSSAKEAGISLISANTIIESENDVSKASAELAAQGANAALVFLGNFGPEGPTSTFIQGFNGPVMVCAAAEESADTLMTGRGDALCGLLNLSYNLSLKNLRVHIPAQPVNTPENFIKDIKHFINISRVHVGVKNLKLLSFGPRPHDFYACNAPIKGLYDLGVEVMENSELDMFQIFNDAAENSDVDDIAADMASELGAGNQYPDLLKKLAQFESALLKFKDENLGGKKYAVFANKCWPAFEKHFGFVPCYINSRLASRGIPVACEVDLYGAVSEYMAQLAGNAPVTLLDINNSVPTDMPSEQAKLEGFDHSDLMMGFHCGNTAKCLLCDGCAMKYQVIMHSLMEPDIDPDITRGTLEGQLKPGDTTMFRFQFTADGQIRSYVGEGRILNIDPQSFGAIGVMAVKGLSRFYRHVLVGQNFPHHTATAFNHCGKVLFDAVQLLTGITPATPLPEAIPYPGENPFQV